jgi:hypothetical protein
MLSPDSQQALQFKSLSGRNNQLPEDHTPHDNPSSPLFSQKMELPFDADSWRPYKYSSQVAIGQERAA